MAHSVEFDDSSFHRLEDISNDSIETKTWDVTARLRAQQLQRNEAKPCQMRPFAADQTTLKNLPMTTGKFYFAMTSQR